MPQAPSSVAEKDAEQTAPGTSQLVRRQPDPDGGKTSIADIVVTKVAGIAAREIQGVHDLGGTAARTLSAVTSRIPIGDDRSRGVSVEVGEREAAIDLTLRIEYGESIPRVAEAVRSNVVKRIEGTTGLKVVEVNIAITDLYFPGDDEPDEPRVQ